jgi:hypothetical protein
MIKTNFPKKEGHYEGGYSNGYMFQIDFIGKSDEESITMLRLFLDNHGFQDIPLPSAERLWWDYFQPDSFGNRGCFVWHPIVIAPSKFGYHGLTLFIFDIDNHEHLERWNLMRKPIH